MRLEVTKLKVVQTLSKDMAPNGGHCLRHTTKAANLERMSYPGDVAAISLVTEFSSWLLWPTFSFQVYPGNLLNGYLWCPLAADSVTVTRGWCSGGLPAVATGPLP